jgi:hypothetical protein
VADVTIDLGPQGPRGRAVVLGFGGRTYSDRFDVESGFQREAFLHRAQADLGLGAEQLPLVEGDILRMARAADSEDGDEDDFRSYTCAELDGGDFSARPLIEGVLYDGLPTIIGAPFKTCKSLVAMDAALSIASGNPWLGYFPVPERRRVSYFFGEGGSSVCQEYARRVALSRTGPLRDVPGLEVVFQVPRFEDGAEMRRLRRHLERTRSEVVFFDNLMLCLSGEMAGVVFHVGGVLGSVLRLCAEAGATPVFVHHFKKARAVATEPGQLFDLTQAGVAEFAGQWCLLTRRRQYDPRLPGTHRLWLTVGGRLGQSGLHALNIEELPGAKDAPRVWRVDRSDAAEAEQSDAADAPGAGERLEDDVRRLAAAAARFPNGETARSLRAAAKIGQSYFPAAVEAALARGLIVCCPVRKGPALKPFKGFRPADCSPPSPGPLFAGLEPGWETEVVL